LFPSEDAACWGCFLQGTLAISPATIDK